MTRIPPKAPPIPQPPRRDHPPGDTAGVKFVDFLKAKPMAEKREAASSPQQHETPSPGCDLRSEHAPRHRELANALGRQVPDDPRGAEAPVHLPPAPVAAAAGYGAPAKMAGTATPGFLGMSYGAKGDVAGLQTRIELPPSAVGKQLQVKTTPSQLAASPVPSSFVALDEGVQLEALQGSGSAEGGAAERLGEPQHAVALAVQPFSSLGNATAPDREPVPMGERELLDLATAAVHQRASESAANTATALVPDAAPVHVEDALLVHSRIGQDSQDWLVRPWRLQANAGLSHRSDQSQALAAPETSSLLAGSRLPSDPLRMGPAAVGLMDDGSLPVRWKNLLRLPVHVESAHERMAADGIEASDPAETKGGEVAAWLHWSQRMLRWNGNAAGTGAVTAWVRDYSLEASEIPALIQALVALSAEQGFPLERVMVNGHEAWTATGYSQQTRGDNDGR